MDPPLIGEPCGARPAGLPVRSPSFPTIANMFAIYVHTILEWVSLGRREQALPVLKELSGNVFAPEGAEAAYILIQDTYDAGDFEEVENKVYAFSDSKTDQTYWLARSFIVLGDSFAEREEWAQARATFESIRDGYVLEGNRDDILEQVNMRIERLDKIAGQ